MTGAVMGLGQVGSAINRGYTTRRPG